MDLDFENCENPCAKSALLSNIVMVCGSTKRSDFFFVISDNLDKNLCILVEAN